MDKMIFTESGVTFVWHGGAYIEAYWEDAYRLRGEDATAFSVIGVWDYGKDQPSIDRTEEALAAEAREWLAENGDDMGKYLEHST